MRFFTRSRVVLAAVGLALAFAVQGYAPSQAATGGTIVQFGADQTLTTSATGVTTTQAFPDGTTAAGCFIKVTSATAAQTITYGNCAGITLTVACASAAFVQSPASDMKGAALNIGGTRTLSGAYDTGGPCSAANPPAGITATSAAMLSGYTAGSQLVWFINNDTNASRDGCFQYVEPEGSSTAQCFANTSAGNNGTFYQVTAQGTTGTLFQSKAASGTGASGNLTIGGVFIVPAQAGATATATATGAATATATTAAATATATTAAATATATTAAATATATSTTPTATVTGTPPTATVMPTATATPSGGPPPPPTFQPTPITPPPGPPTNTPTVTPVPPTATDTPQPTATTPSAAPTNTPKPKPKATKTPTPAPTATKRPAAARATKTPTPVVVPTIPKTGAGGTYVYSSTGAARLSRAAVTSAAPAALPQTGGGGGSDPTGPLAPLALLGAAAIVAGRAVRRFRK